MVPLIRDDQEPGRVQQIKYESISHKGKIVMRKNPPFKYILLAIFSSAISACSTIEKPINHSSTDTKKQGAVLRYDTVHHPVIARGGMVSTQNRIASEVGKDILLQGGNAVDSAVAIGFALAVTLPRAGNIGGSGFILMYLREKNQTIALDFRSMAPNLASLDELKTQEGEVDWHAMSFGAKAPGVPGTVAGLYKAWSEHGVLPWASLLKPAIELAENGFIITPDLAFALSEAEKLMAPFPSSTKIFMRSNGAAPIAGDRLYQKDLAWSLKQIAENGADAFYRGEIAKKIDGYMRATNGFMRLDDLNSYEVAQREPISTNFNGHNVVTMPPVSGGGIAILQMLNVLSEFPMSSYAQGSAESLHIIAETMKRVAANRRVGIGDPDFVDVPTKTMIGADVARFIAKDISLTESKDVKSISPLDVSPFESADTTHYSVADSQGNVVSTTYTLGYSFGSGLVIPGTGILMDNQIRNFSHRIPNHANSMTGGKRMVSTMAPTIVFNPMGEPYLVTGSPGGSRIPNIVTQLIVNTVQYGMNVAQATHAPRIHQQWRTPNLGYESGHSVDTLTLLESKGHTIERQQTMGSTQSIMIKDGYFYGSADPRRPGAAALGVDRH